MRALGLRFYWSEAVLAPDSFFRKYRDDREKLTELLPALVHAIDHIRDEYDILPLKDLSDPGGVVPFMFEALEHGIDAKI